MDTIKYLWDLINNYPLAVKWLAGVWMVITALLGAALIIKRPIPAFPASVNILVMQLEILDEQWRATAQFTVDNRIYDVYHGQKVSLPRFSTGDTVGSVSITSLHPTIKVMIRATSRDGKQKEFVSASKPLPEPGLSLVIKLHPIDDDGVEDRQAGSITVMTAK
jgi:hypothetical protein